MFRSFWVKASLAAALTAAGAAPAQAHHTLAMYDGQKIVALEGVIKEFQWTNPHTWVQLLVKQPNGQEVEWSIEGGPPNGLARQGWSRKSLKAGDKVVLQVHPLKDGTAGGSLVSASVDGKAVGGHG